MTPSQAKELVKYVTERIQEEGYVVTTPNDLMLLSRTNKMKPEILTKSEMRVGITKAREL